MQGTGEREQGLGARDGMRWQGARARGWGTEVRSEAQRPRDRGRGRRPEAEVRVRSTARGKIGRAEKGLGKRQGKRQG